MQRGHAHDGQHARRLAHHLVQRVVNEALGASVSEMNECGVQRGNRVGGVQNAEGDGVGAVCEHAVEVGGVDDDTLL